MNAKDCVPLVEVTRGHIVESIQYGAFIVVDAAGRVLASAGNPELMTYPRSSMKPFQALPFIEKGGDAAFNLTEQEIAIMCASHSGTDLHYSVLKRMHEKIGLVEDDLACGVHWPGDAETRTAMLKADQEPTPFRHNCSGKHTGMLAHAVMNGDAKIGYLDSKHPVQVSIRQALAEMVDMDQGDMPLGIDGCSAPVYGIPLQNMAHAVALLADPVSLSKERATACRKITSAMIAHPEMVAGPGKFDTDLMSIADFKVFCKAGAEGYQIIGVMPDASHKGSPGLGIAIKISDGDPQGRARTSVSLTLLSGLGVLDKDELDRLADYGNKPVKNWRKLDVGEIRSVFSVPQGIK